MTERSEATDADFWADAEDGTALRRFRALVNAIDDGIYQLDPAGNFVAVNDVIVETTGYDRAELLGSHVSLLLKDGDIARIEGAIRERLEDAGADLPALELEVTTADGEEIPCELRFSLLREDGTVRGTVGVIRDVGDIASRIERERKAVRYETIVETIEDGIYVLDDEHRFAAVNGAYAEMTGYSREELVGSHCSLVVGDEVSVEAAERSARMTTHGENAATIEAEIRRRDGTRVPAESKFTALVSDDGGYQGSIGVVRDVSGRTERERELQKYETTVETVEDGIYVVAGDGRFTMVNRSFAEMVGYDPDELTGAHVSLVVDEDVHRRAKEIEAELVDRGVENPSLEAELRTASGGRVPAEATFAVLPGGDGVRERVGVVRDITERRERERALEESEQRYRTLIEHFPGAVALYDDELRYTLVGGELVDALGVSTGDVVGSTVYDRYPDDLLERVEPYFRAAFDGDSHTFEERYRDRDLWAHTLPVRNGDDEIFAGMLLVQDITERKTYRREIEASNERLEQFAYAASHDLQEPLRMITSYLRLLERRYGDDLDDDGREFVDYAVDGAVRMREMIDGLLEYSRVETRGDPFEPVDLDAAFEEALENLRVKVVETDATIAAEPLPRVRGDAGQLRQLFQNLLDNAITYSGDGPPRVTVAAERRGAEWVVSVADEGIGIDADDRDRIFEVFQRLHSQDEHAGTGIGLALCKRIVERHGGEIRVESEPGAGSTFFVTLPATADDES